MRAVLRDHEEGGGALHFRYDPDAISALKARGWRWDPDRKFWWGRPHVIDDGVEALELLGYDVADERTRDQVPSRDPGPSHVVIDRTTYYERLIARAPPEDQQAAYRRLMAAFHPDRYGDEEEAKAINAAWDRLRGRNRRPA